MVLWIFIGVVAVWMIYSGLPTIYYKYIHQQPYTPGQLDLTFDDGPNPNTSPHFLDALQAAHRQATFFLVGKKVLKHPEIPLRAQAEGHAIGLHCFEHGQPAFWTPWKTRKDMNEAKHALEEAGLHPRYYRPPHGWVNLTMLHLIKKWSLTLKLWTVLPGDWDENKDWRETLQALRDEEQTGGVICLHDSNDHMDSPSQAPYHTLKALRAYLGLPAIENQKERWKAGKI